MAGSSGSLHFSDGPLGRDRLARAVARGELRRLARGIYTSDTTRSAESVVRGSLWAILAHETPGAVISDLSVEDGGTGTNAVVYVVSTRDRALQLPGMTILPRRGAGPVEGDSPLPGGLWIAGEARALLDNLAPSRANRLGRRRTGGAVWAERRLDRLCAERGADGLNRLRDQASAVAADLDRGRELEELDRLIGAALQTRPNTVLSSPELRARAADAPFDQHRAEVFSRLVAALTDMTPSPLLDLPIDAPRRLLLPFYEAYFSNYIEGTEFTLEEAAAIVFDRVVPDGRPADAHDVSGTYALTSSVLEVPRSGQELLALLQSRHAVLMGGRPEADPGSWKTRANRAGSTEFVQPELVRGTLLRGFDIAADLLDPFARAVYLMFLVSEVHPFADGNGRTARIFMNAELMSAGQVRIVVPTVFRANYLAALKAATLTGHDGALIATLQFAQRWTARIDWSTRAHAEADLARTNALRDAREAEDAGVRLLLP